jgi:hypothetical protein
LRLLGGNVVVDRVPSAELLSASDYQNDFHTMLGGRDGEVWLAWVAFRHQGDQIPARRFDGTRWGSAQEVTEGSSDIFLTKMGRDRNGNIWVVWSAQVNGNFDLYAHRFDGKAWSRVERIFASPLSMVRQATFRSEAVAARPIRDAIRAKGQPGARVIGSNGAGNSLKSSTLAANA